MGKKLLLLLCLVATLILGATCKGFRFRLVHRYAVHPTLDLRGPLTRSAGGAVLVNISIGKPPVPQLLAMDTGGTTTWVRCRPCATPTRMCTYDPATSATYEPMYDWGGALKQFTSVYQDGVIVTGPLGYDTFTFTTSDDNIMEEVRDSIFGCVATVQNDNMLDANGLLGLRINANSFFLQWEDYFSTFSYCLGDLKDLYDERSFLFIGDGAAIVGDTIEMDFAYQVDLDVITIGEKVIDMGDIERKILIDSGSVYTYITKDLLEPLMDEVRAIIGTRGLKTYADRLCYYGSLYRLGNFPSMRFNLGGVAGIIELGIESMFDADDEGFCLAIEEAKGDPPINILGLLAQQYYNFGFNLKDKTVSISPTDDCDEI